MSVMPLHQFIFQLLGSFMYTTAQVVVLYSRKLHLYVTIEADVGAERDCMSAFLFVYIGKHSESLSEGAQH